MQRRGSWKTPREIWNVIRLFRIVEEISSWCHVVAFVAKFASCLPHILRKIHVSSTLLCVFIYIRVYQRDDLRHPVTQPIEYTVIALSFAIHLNDRLDRFDILQRDQKPRLYTLSFFPSFPLLCLSAKKSFSSQKFATNRNRHGRALPSNLRTILSFTIDSKPGSGGTQSPNLSTPGHPPS